MAARLFIQADTAEGTMRIRDKGIIVGEMKPGRRNLITDVNGVKVGHATIDRDDSHTGVTAVIPGTDLTRYAPAAACFVLNGYGKTEGTVQIEELGRLETPVLLTNTLCVGRCTDALTEYMTELYESRGKKLTSISCTVGETNDSRISRIAGRAVSRDDVYRAIESASEDFELGAVGAGRGTVCFGLKGGIGSASRQIRLGGETYTVGILVQSNYGALKDLVINGRACGREILSRISAAEETDRGSVMIIAAADLPLTCRQLKRVIKRASAGIIRCGSHMGHGSGDVIIGFTTANQIPLEGSGIVSVKAFPENYLDMAFRAVIEATEEAVLDSMYAAEAVRSYDGKLYHSLSEFL